MGKARSNGALIMEIILLEKIEKLGQMGDIVQVKSGYARNFLLPHGKALRATETNKKHFEGQRAQLEADNLKSKLEAEKLGKKLEGLSITIVRQAGEAGQLYGSVNAKDIAGNVTASGFTISRQQVELLHPIKALGLYDVQITLHPEVSVKVSANIARSIEEAKIQAKTGEAVVSNEEKSDDIEKVDEKVEEVALQAVTEQAERIFEQDAIPHAKESVEKSQETQEEENKIQEKELD